MTIQYFVISYNAHTTQATQLFKVTKLPQNTILPTIFTLKTSQILIILIILIILLAAP